MTAEIAKLRSPWYRNAELVLPSAISLLTLLTALAGVIAASRSGYFDIQHKLLELHTAQLRRDVQAFEAQKQVLVDETRNLNETLTSTRQDLETVTAKLERARDEIGVAPVALRLARIKTIRDMRAPAIDELVSVYQDDKPDSVTAYIRYTEEYLASSDVDLPTRGIVFLCLYLGTCDTAWKDRTLNAAPELPSCDAETQRRYIAILLSTRWNPRERSTPVERLIGALPGIGDPSVRGFAMSALAELQQDNLRFRTYRDLSKRQYLAVVGCATELARDGTLDDGLRAIALRSLVVLAPPVALVVAGEIVARLEFTDALERQTLARTVWRSLRLARSLFSLPRGIETPYIRDPSEWSLDEGLEWGKSGPWSAWLAAPELAWLVNPVLTGPLASLDVLRMRGILREKNLPG